MALGLEARLFTNLKQWDIDGIHVRPDLRVSLRYTARDYQVVVRLGE